MNKVLNPVFKGLMLTGGSKPCFIPLPVLHELWHWRTSLFCGLSSEPSVLKHLLIFCFLPLSSPTDLCLSLLWSLSSSHQEDSARGSLWYKLGKARPCEAELGYTVHNGVLSSGFDQSLLGLQFQLQLNINGWYLFICLRKHQEVNINSTEMSVRGKELHCAAALIRPLPICI